MPKSSTPIEQLLAELHHQDFMTRCNAARELGKSRDPRAVEALLPDLSDPDWRVRRNAAQALGAAKAKPAVEPLIQALHDRTMTVRARAAVALGRIKDARAIPALIDALCSKDSMVYDAAHQALLKLGKACIPSIISHLNTAAAPERLRLFMLLAEIHSPEAIDGLVETAKDADRMTRYQIYNALSNIPDPRALDALLAALADPDLFARGRAARVLGRFKDPRVVPALLKQLVDYQLNGQYNDLYRSVTGAMQELARLPEVFSGILENKLPALAGVLDEESRLDLSLTISQFADLLKTITGQAASSEPPSAPMQKALNMLDQARGAGNATVQLVDDLTSLLRTPDPLTRTAAALSLVWYRDPRALPALSTARLDADPNVQSAAAWAYETLRITTEGGRHSF